MSLDMRIRSSVTMGFTPELPDGVTIICGSAYTGTQIHLDITAIGDTPDEAREKFAAAKLAIIDALK